MALIVSQRVDEINTGFSMTLNLVPQRGQPFKLPQRRQTCNIWTIKGQLSKGESSKVIEKRRLTLLLELESTPVILCYVVGSWWSIQTGHAWKITGLSYKHTCKGQWESSRHYVKILSRGNQEGANKYLINVKDNKPQLLYNIFFLV